MQHDGDLIEAEAGDLPALDQLDLYIVLRIVPPMTRLGPTRPQGTSMFPMPQHMGRDAVLLSDLTDRAPHLVSILDLTSC